MPCSDVVVSSGAFDCYLLPGKVAAAHAHRKCSFVRRDNCVRLVCVKAAWSDACCVRVSVSRRTRRASLSVHVVAEDIPSYAWLFLRDTVRNKAQDVFSSVSSGFSSYILDEQGLSMVRTRKPLGACIQLPILFMLNLVLLL
jgi:ribosomal protein L36